MIINLLTSWCDRIKEKLGNLTKRIRLEGKEYVPLKRAEFLLGITGVIFTLISLLITIVFLIMSSLSIYSLTGIVAQYVISDENNGVTNFLLRILFSFRWMPLLIYSLGLILAIISLIKVNDSTKTTGVLFLTSGILMFILTLGASMIQSLFFIVAGILSLVRTSKQIVSVSPNKLHNKI